MNRDAIREMNRDLALALRRVPDVLLLDEITRRHRERTPAFSKRLLRTLEAVERKHGIPWPVILGASTKPAVIAARHDMVKRLDRNHGPSAIADMLGWTFDRVENILLKFRS